jgi:hypothetical protein
MQFVCEASPKTWFRIETEAEATLEARAMNHSVDKYFKQAEEQAIKSYVPPKSGAAFEQSIGRKGHVQKSMPIFLTLRDGEGKPLATAMLPPGGKDDKAFRPIIVGPSNADPFVEHGDAIARLGRHYGMPLDPVRCFPYRR